jgi:O-antigen/teichoic acid export membrane protein
MLRSGLFNVVGQVIRVASALLVIPLLTRLLGIEGYGLWVLVSAITGVVILAEAGLTTSTTVFVAQDLATQDEARLASALTTVCSLMLVLASAAAVLLWVFSPTLAGYLPNLSPEQQELVGTTLQIAALSIWALLMQQVMGGIVMAYERYDLVNGLRIAQSISSSVGLVAAAWLGRTIVGLMVVQAAVNIFILLAGVIIVASLTRFLIFRPRFERHRFVAIGRYSAVTWAGSLGSTLFLQGDRLIVGAILGPYLLGIYGVITGLAVQINSLSALLVQPILPLASHLYHVGSAEAMDRLRTEFHKSTALNVLAVGILCLVLVSVAPLVLRVMLPSTIEGYQVTALRLSSIVYAIYSTSATGYFVLFATDDAVTNTVLALLGATLALSMIAVLSQLMGLLGAVLGNAGYIVVILATVRASRRINLPLAELRVYYVVPAIVLLLNVCLYWVLPKSLIVTLPVALLSVASMLAWGIHIGRADLIKSRIRIPSAT